MQYAYSRWIFFRLLGLVYLIAFLSYWSQVTGLIGEQGILPAHDFLQFLRNRLGIERLWFFPTLAWISASNEFLQFLCAFGTIWAALFLVNAIAPIIALPILYLLYLSLATVSMDFMGFQWDILLLETGFLSILFAPLYIVPRTPKNDPKPYGIALLLMHVLLFKLIFLSGAVKLLSNDSTWRNLTALSYHYETQPLPTPLSWYFNILPLWFHKISNVFMFVIELIVPFCIFLKKPFCIAAAFAIISLQLLIAATGNYTFFNILTISLAILLLNDSFISFLLSIVRVRIHIPTIVPTSKTPPLSSFKKTIVIALLFLNTFSTLGILFQGSQVSGPLFFFPSLFSPFRVVNTYGLFAVMTTTRREIIVEGSNDQKEWKQYEFVYKPGDIKNSPAWIAPHQPRLDWQMWFAALTKAENAPWFTNFFIRLLQGSEDVLSLLKTNPFKEKPPRYIRALMYEYHFTDSKTRREKGEWWRREYKEVYLPSVSLDSLRNRTF